jgi:alkylation response protein AidB-like acyl-CoA dehydrogenase
MLRCPNRGSASFPFALYGSQDLRDELLPNYLTGRLLPAFALSEPDAGSDAAAIATTAYRSGNNYVINGRKAWTSNCGLADLYVVFARIEGQAGAALQRLRLMDMTVASRLRNVFRSCLPTPSEPGPLRIAVFPPSA